MRVRIVVLTTVLASAVGLLVPARAADPTVVLATDANEYEPSATESHLSWTEEAGRSIVYAMPFGGSRVRVSERGSSGFNGSVDGTTVTYTQAWFDRDRSDIYRFDMGTKTRTKVGAPVSTKAWEYSPTADGDMLAFSRLLDSGERRLILFSDATQTTRTIATTTGNNRVIDGGQLNGDWLVYEKTTYGRNGIVTSCDVFRYDIASDTTVKIPNPNDRCQYYPAVDEAGTVFFARSGFGCGLNVQLRAYVEGGAVSTLVDLRDGFEIWGAPFAVDNGDSTADVYYGTGKCPTSRRGGTSDIYKVTWSAV